MPLASAAETPNLIKTLNKDKIVNAASNNASTGTTTILSKEEIAKLQKWLKSKNLTNDNGLKLGSTGEQVKQLQTWLKENEFYNGEVDGNFGTDTEAAVKTFQKEVGLNEDGQVGEYTLLAMEQWDEYASAMTNNANVSKPSEKVYSSASKKQSYKSKKAKSYSNTKKAKNYSNTKNAKSYKKSNSRKTYSRTRYGYTNGMDCWAMSSYLSGKLRSQGYNVRTIQYATSMSSRHRSVQYYNGNSWVNYDYKGNGYSSIYYATSNSKRGSVIG